MWAGSVGCVNVIFTGAGMCLLVNEARPKACSIIAGGRAGDSGTSA